MDTRLAELLICPICRGPLRRERVPGKSDLLTCAADRLGFPIRDGIPVMLENEAIALEDTPTALDAAALLRGHDDADAS